MIAFAAGCVADRYVDPIAVMVDREAGYSRRRAAEEQARRELADSPRRIAALETILWQRGYPAWQRRDAVDQLVEHDEAAFRASLPRRFGLLSDWDTINHIFDLAVERGWEDFTPVVVRNYARRAHGIPDDQRPERRVLRELHPDTSVEQVIFDVFADPDDVLAYADRVAAWELMVRLSDGPTLARLLEAAPARTPLAIDLKAAAADLAVLPPHREGVLWMQYLRQPQRRGFWDQAAAVVARLDSDRRAGLSLRHLPVLVCARAEDLGRPVDVLAGRVAAAVRTAEHHMTGPTYDGPMRDWPQTFAHWSDQLSWGDLLAIDTMLQAMGDVQLAQSLFEQAERDRRDPGTEYGGVLAHDGGSFVAIAFEPMVRRHDLKFIPPQAMVERLYTGLAHYHFHAQRHRNRAYAGPGEGDLKTADRLGATCLVLTFIDEDRLNVDYYQPGRIVIDLGTLKR